jgi:hypothetical protein
LRLAAVNGGRYALIILQREDAPGRGPRIEERLIMKITALIASGCLAALVAAGLGGAAGPAGAQETAAASTEANAENVALTAEEMEILVARIALYPDDLVAAIVSASLYPLQVVEAARFLEKNAKDKNLKPDPKWDGSVISILNYPDVVKMMSDDLDWTQSLGEAAVNQQDDLLTAIQQLREKAVALGVLKSDDKVVVEQAAAPAPAAGAAPAPVQETIVIKSADPQVIYVPQYEPEMLYEPNYVMPAQPIYWPEPYPAYYWPGATFWTGVVTGAVWASVIDWDDNHFWGGDVDIDVDWNNGNINIGDIDIGRIDVDKIDFDRWDIDRNNLDLNKMDLSKIDASKLDLSKIDRSKLNLDKSKIDRDKISSNLKSRDKNRLDNKMGNLQRPTTLPGQAGGRPQTKDIRKNIEQGLAKPATRPGNTGGNVANKLPGDANRPQARPGDANRPQARPGDLNRPQARPADRPTKEGLQRPANVDRPSPSPRPAARPDTRPARPAAVGDYDRGTKVNKSSNRAKTSREAPQYKRPSGNKPSANRSGGGAPKANRGGGGSRKVSRGGGGRGRRG